MTDVMVSVRLPSSLLEELNSIVKKQHYLDASEAIRGILRQKFEEQSDPLKHELAQIRLSIQSELKRSIAKKSEERIIEEMKKIREKIRDEL